MVELTIAAGGIFRENFTVGTDSNVLVCSLRWLDLLEHRRSGWRGQKSGVRTHYPPTKNPPGRDRRAEGLTDP